MHEQASLHTANIILFLFDRFIPQDNTILKAVALKIFKSKMPSTVQNLAIIYARMINKDAEK